MPWEGRLLLRTERCDGVNYQTLPLAAQIRYTFSTTSFSCYLPAIGSVHAEDDLRLAQPCHTAPYMAAEVHTRMAVSSTLPHPLIQGPRGLQGDYEL